MAHRGGRQGRRAGSGSKSSRGASNLPASSRTIPLELNRRDTVPLTKSKFDCMAFTCIYCEDICQNPQDDAELDWSDKNVLQCYVCLAYLQKECIPMSVNEIDKFLKENNRYVCENCTGENSVEEEDDAMYGKSQSLVHVSPQVEQIANSTKISQKEARDHKNDKKSADSKVKQTAASATHSQPNKSNTQTFGDSNVKQTVETAETLSQGNKSDTQILGDRLDELITLGRETKSRLDVMDVKWSQTERKLKEIDQKIDTQMPILERRIDDIIDMKMSNGFEKFEEEVINARIDAALEEYSDREQRKRNVLIVNIRESTKTNIYDKQEDDMIIIDRLFKRLIRFNGIEDLEQYPVRLGKPGDKPRMIRVTFRHEFLAKLVTKRAKEMSDALNPFEKDKFKMIYINRDFTKMERDARKALQTELKTRKAQGEQNLTIRGNKIVRFQPRPNHQGNYHRSYATAAASSINNYRQFLPSNYPQSQNDVSESQSENAQDNASVGERSPQNSQQSERIDSVFTPSRIRSQHPVLEKGNQQLEFADQIMTRKSSHNMTLRQNNLSSPVGRGTPYRGAYAASPGRIH